ncbi:MAG: T9SS type A sorting domain-containing protein [Ignavibacteria bacterium]|nr:T9SS type A sorting domain-containing protein [Ignavibacteria bacterium]
MKTLCFGFLVSLFMAGILFAQPHDKIRPLNKTDATLSPKQPNSGSPFSTKNMWDIKLFWDATSITGKTGHAGIVYLNTSGDVWISRWDSDTIFIWTATTTNYLYTVTIPGVSEVRAMTFDGENIYAANNTANILIIDPVKRMLKGTMPAPQAARYVTFDQSANNGKGGLWIGNFTTDLQLISLSGNLIRTIPYTSLGNTGIYSAAYDPSGPYLWLFGQGNGYGSPQTISQLTVSTGKPTNLSRDISLDLEAHAEQTGMYANADSMLAGGLCLLNGVFPGITALAGVMQGLPDIIFAVEVGSQSVPPSTITINRTFSFGDPKASGSYRILSLPGDINMPLSQLFTGAGEQKKNWDAFYDNGKAENYLVEFDNSAAFTFRPGNAFWVVSKNALNVSAEVNPVATDAEGVCQIPLHAGWNLISSPFADDVGWTEVQLANQLANNSLIYAWNGSWSNPASLNAYQGYYFNNLNNLATLKIPRVTTAGTLPSGLHKKTLYNPDKYVKAYLYSDGKEISPVYASIDKNSSDGFDEFDYFTPPSDFSDECIYILNESLRTDYKHLFIDSRPGITQGQVYSLVIKTTSKKSCELRFSGTGNFEGYEVYLADSFQKRFYNLRENPAISLNPEEKIKEFSLIIGNKNFIEGKKGLLLPKAYTLFQNYPNPFNPNTVIAYELPVESRVQLKVFNVLGKEIITLKDELEAAGRHEIMFEAGSLPSGIYFYTLRSGSFVKTGKMILLK